VVEHGAELFVRAEDVRVDGTPPLYLHTSAYVSIRRRTSACVGMRGV
jgi:hypothetical protein